MTDSVSVCVAMRRLSLLGPLLGRLLGGLADIGDMLLALPRSSTWRVGDQVVELGLSDLLNGVILEFACKLLELLSAGLSANDNIVEIGLEICGDGATEFLNEGVTLIASPRVEGASDEEGLAGEAAIESARRVLWRAVNIRHGREATTTTYMMLDISELAWCVGR